MMGNRIIPCFLMLLWLCSINHLHAQDDDTIQFAQGMPLSGGQTESNDVQTDYSDDRFIKISHEQIPSGLRKTLEGDKLFRNWQNEQIMYDKSSELYWVNFTSDRIVRSYGFSKSGSPVSVKEQTVQNEERPPSTK